MSLGGVTPVGKPCLTGAAPLLLLFAQLAPQRDTGSGFRGSRTALVKRSAPAWCPCGFCAFARLHCSALVDGIRGGRGGVLKNVKRGRERDAVSAKTSGRKVRRYGTGIQTNSASATWNKGTSLEGLFSSILCGSSLSSPAMSCFSVTKLLFCVSFYLFYTKRVIFM